MNLTKSRTAKFVAGLAGFAIALSFVVTPVTTSAATIAELQAMIASLSAQLSALSGTPVTTTGYQFNTNLTLNSKGTDVLNLQKALNFSADTQVALTGAGSPGNETSFFGVLTKQAVSKFQVKYGITPTAGYFGPITRAKLNTMSGIVVVVPPAGTTLPAGCTSTVGWSPTTGVLCSTGGTTYSGPISVALATTVSYGALVSPSATAQLASFTFTGNGAVSNVTLRRLGVSSDSTLTSVYLYDGATRLTDAASVSNGVISFNSPSGLFTVTGSRTVTVRADIAAIQGGATVGVGLTGYTAVGGTNTTVDLVGNIQGIVSNLNAATAQLGSNIVGNQGVNAGASNLAVWANTLTIGTRAVSLQAVAFKFIGSAPATSLSNVKLVVDGVVVASGAVDANNNLVFNMSSAPLTLTTGSHNMSVQADVLSGASRNFYLSLQNSGDIMLADSQLQGVNVALTSFAVNNGGLITINQGTASVQVDPAFNVTNVVSGGSNVAIAQFKFTSYGEDVKVNSLAVGALFNNATASLRNMGVYVNGGQVGSTNNYTATTTFGTNNLFTIPAGQSVVVTIKADMVDTSNVNLTSGPLVVLLPLVANNAQGVTSFQMVSVPSATVTSNAVTVGTGTVTVSPSVSLGNFAIAPNTANVKIGSYVIQASSAEGLRVNSIQVNLAGSINPLTGLSNLRITTPAGTTNPVNPQTSNTFSLSGFTIPASGSATVDVFADILGTLGTASSSIVVTAQGTPSNVNITSGNTATGQVVTVGTGQMMAPTLGTGTMSAQYVVGDTINQALATYNFVSTTSPATITELRFNVGTNGAISTLTAGGITSQPVNGVVTLAGLNIPVAVGYSGTNVVVTTTYGHVGLNALASPTLASTTLTYVRATMGSTVITPTVNIVAPATGQISLVASKPTLTIASPGGTLAVGQVKIARITATADAAGAIKILQLPVRITVSSASTANLAAQELVIKDVYGSPIANATSTTVTVAANGTGTSEITFTGGYTVPAGTSVSFDVYATVSGGLGAPAASSIVTSLITPASFQWIDVGGNSGTLYGTLLTNYPSNTSVLTN